MGLLGKVIGAAAEQLENQEALKPPDPYRWAKRAAAGSILLLGWMFILWANRFRVSAPTIFVCLGFLAIELAVYNLFRTGAQMAADEDNDDSTWGRPLGARGELEREKKTLLKAIKEAEFDREMGKLSKVDADEMIGLYRARAIEVIKELDRLGETSVGTVREQIEREVKARLELEQRTRGAAEKAIEKQENFKKKKGKGAKAHAKAEAAKAADTKAADAKAGDATPAAATPAAATDDRATSVDAKTDTKAVDAKPVANATVAAADESVDSDDDDDADDADADAKSDTEAKTTDAKSAADSESAPGVDLSATESSKTAAKEAAQ
jgi:hypothetical protein